MPKGLSVTARHFKRNDPVNTREMFVQAGLEIRLSIGVWLGFWL